MVRLTAKQRGLIKGIAAGKTNRQAALDAGYGGGVNPESASAQASQALNKPNVMSALEAALDRAGATLEKSAEVIAKAHAAEKTVVTKLGDVVEIGPDHATRLRAAELNGKFRKLLTSGPEEGGQIMGVGFFILKGKTERGL